MVVEKSGKRSAVTFEVTPRFGNDAFDQTRTFLLCA